MERIIESNLAYYVKKRFEIMHFIHSIADSEIRLVMRLRYLEHKTWRQIAFAIGVDGDGSTERKKLDRYLLEVSRNSQTDTVKWSCQAGVAI